ncbi:hypothetical protein G4V62_05790 [Bacillaceae bacterium SIJ1]|uniref:hypothetical protein n=1 Tax=Litoribacterium kuwaitense TaxID=1398745 RepID=UPI0013EC311F|nr:hypothetical protein [Litoribacterium kuwaitense]NGP44493.1 hypothetical protein [Litoribacterium kuwaitense]
METLQSVTEILNQRGRELPLRPKTLWDEELSEKIKDLPNSELAREDAPHWGADALRSALLLWNDDLYASHELSQKIEQPTGSFLHGVMHRREGDFSNANYWFRRAGVHEIYPELNKHASEHLPDFNKSAWDPVAFVEEVEKATSQKDAVLIVKCQEVQRIEMDLIIQYIRTL